MPGAEHAALAGWDSFYVIVGSSGAALIGLQFVVIALISETRMTRDGSALSAFGTPTVVHLVGALLISTVMSAPWPSLFALTVALVICGVTGLGYGARVIRRAYSQTEYAPVWQDWLWHMVLPDSAYAALVLAALFLSAATQTALFVVAGAALGLLLIAIHNAWDTVVYIVVSNQKKEATTTE
jgi:hypothetical protein